MKLWDRLVTWVVEATHHPLSSPQLEMKLSNWAGRNGFTLHAMDMGERILYIFDSKVIELHVEIPDGPVGELLLVAWPPGQLLDNQEIMRRLVNRSRIKFELTRFYEDALSLLR